MAENKLILDIRDISKTVKNQTIVHPLQLKLYKGQVMALCGGNGAGKSTILRMIVGILRPDGGTIRVSGLEVSMNRQAYVNNIGYMPDDFDFGSKLSAQETLYFYAGLKKVSKARADELLELVGLFEVRSKKVSSFSKGMKQRLLFAQAQLAAPPLLVLDEPTNGLDPYWMQKFVELIGTLKQSGQTIIFSTHHLQIAEETADHALFLNAGQVLSKGTVLQYKQTYGSSGLNGAYNDIMKKHLMSLSS
ncbi:ABC transporter ATP-binding protein [Ferviditalea candida]|uniref:ABC transporter ATP-binding protein n=1 Tax=Ferviditalea candida TaxID=3108399 RepID=A0ABU5ZK86_9BACL|nr:ABC transporter ATP-binding protein [Paenibacillaceae bacterium T2]